MAQNASATGPDREPPEPSEPVATRAEYERQFRRAGLPLFIADYTARTDVFNRAIPFLAFIFLVQAINGLDENWSPLANLGAVLAGLAILLTPLALLNRSKGRRIWAIPDRIGRLELAGFVIVPALIPLVIGGHLQLALETAVENLIILGLIYVTVGYGVFSILRWVIRRVLKQLTTATQLLARAVPLLMVIVLIAFISTEMWRVFSTVPGENVAMLIGLFFILGTAFLLVRLPREVRALEREAGQGSPPLNKRERRNVGLVLFISQGLQVLAVSLLVAAFFIIFGAIAVTAPVREAWTGSVGSTLLTVELFGQDIEVTAELLRVSIGLAAFSGFYFTIAMLSDATYREEFLEELTSEMRASFKARREYLSLGGPGSGRE